MLYLNVIQNGRTSLSDCLRPKSYVPLETNFIFQSVLSKKVLTEMSLSSHRNVFLFCVKISFEALECSYKNVLVTVQGIVQTNSLNFIRLLFIYHI